MPDDLTDYEERVRALAYRMWDEAGRPEGQHEYFWDKAKAEIDAADEITRRVPRT
jgi:hypothetical protein